MGAQQSSTALPENELPAIADRLSQHTVLKQYRVEEALQPGSGRLMKTFRLRHREHDSAATLKTCWIYSTKEVEREAIVAEQKQELERLRKCLHDTPSASPFLAYWAQTDDATRPGRSGGFWTPIYLLRPYFYTTVADRLASRPWLHSSEKVWIAYQLLKALDHLHKAGVVHGCISTENCAYTASGWLVLTDMASYKAVTDLPDDDPSEFVYYFQPTDDARGTRCYLAPERFQSQRNNEGTALGGQQQRDPLTPAMDLFSAGCVLTEIFLNSESCFTLGDLMEYRGDRGSPSLQQKLNKIEFSGIRAACKHMLALDPHQRLSAATYLERLGASDAFPTFFETLLYPLLESVVSLTPDARLAVAVRQYRDMVWEAAGVWDEASHAFLQQVLTEPTENQEPSRDSVTTMAATLDAERLQQESAELLRQLEALRIDGTSDAVASSNLTQAESNPTPSRAKERSELSQQSLLMYLQVITAQMRHVQRPASKLVALKVLMCLGKHVSDEARLQRVVPVTISLLQDQEATVRALAIRVLTSTLSSVKSFPPSDSQIFPQFIFKRVNHLVSDPCRIVRLSFAQCLAQLAETAQRFLDISHAVRLYEAVGSGIKSADERDAIFGDDVHRLLDTVPRGKGSGGAETPSDATGKTLSMSTYSTDLSGLQETVSRWVVQLTTDQSDLASLSKRAVLSELERLCSFFGLEGVMAFILPQILGFLNERKDWELRTALFERLPSVCTIVGRAATEEFVLPCVEIGLIDKEERVVSKAMLCLASLVQSGLVSRSAIIGSGTPSDANSLLHKYGVLLLHPSQEVRLGALEAFATVAAVLGPLDAEVFLKPVLTKFLRRQPTTQSLASSNLLASCLDTPWERERYGTELDLVAASTGGPEVSDPWTSVGISLSEGRQHRDNDRSTKSPQDVNRERSDPQAQSFREYMRMLLRHSDPVSYTMQNAANSSSVLSSGIDGSAKLAQSVMFPKQNGRGQDGVVPAWYTALRDETQSLATSADASIRSVSALGDVYGLSIMGPLSGAVDGVVVDASQEEQGEQSSNEKNRTEDARTMEASFAGSWGAEALLNPVMVDTCLLVTKLKAMKVPPLPPKLGGDWNATPSHRAATKEASPTKAWKPKVNAMIATSNLTSGHDAPVMRLAVSANHRFFVSGSYDGTCRVWDLPQIENSSGVLESSAVYSGHSRSKVNDIAMLEGSHSVVSGATDGSVHVWRVDLASSKTGNPSKPQVESRAIGSSEVRRIDQKEGQVLGVSHFTSLSASVITFATQKGNVHSWDLREGSEPFLLRHCGDVGNMTSIALGSDRNWLVTGTSRGYVSLWDIRYQQPVNVWRHSRKSPIVRLATSYVLSPQQWGITDPTSSARPFVFVASGPNECGMFDVMDGSCRGCFRALTSEGISLTKGHADEPPVLTPVPIRMRHGVCSLQNPETKLSWPSTVPSSSSINCMVGSIGAGDQSYLLTGGSDSVIRYWDFGVPSKCLIVSGQRQDRPSYERIDFNGHRRLMLCRQPTSIGIRDLDAVPRKLFRGLKRLDHFHYDAVQDLKILENNCIISCSRDSTIKVWR